MENLAVPVVFIDNDQTFLLGEVKDNEYFMRWYRIACAYYKNYTGEIIEADCFVALDMTDKPKFRIRHPSGVLPPCMAYLEN